MAIAAFIIVGLLLISSTVIASMLIQRRADRYDRLSEDEYADRLRKKLRTRLSHELRTPLNSIITLSQLLLEDDKGPLSPEQRQYIEVIRRSGRNLLALVDNIAEGRAPAREAAEPAAQPAPAQLGATVTSTSGPIQFEPPRENGPVLLIEDDAIERQRVGSFIEAAGYQVTRAASGEEGLALLRSRPFAAVVLDLVMPEMTGLDVLRAARTEDRLADVRFIVLSALYMTKNERQVLGPKVADVVRKGETMPRALTLALHRAVRPAPAQPHVHGDGGRHL
ncbi:MAG TPA: histidine kinase dimerization/phospho-acceptor domain-containing protein [Polyangia bacterium]|jgi:CheY-like chemotaxis protein